MRLQQYLNEDTWSYDDMVSLIKANCKPFLKDWQSKYIGKFLYSGRDSSKNYDIKTIRKNRRPMSMHIAMHNIIDDWFYKKFSVRARSNAMFGSFNDDHASEYGDVYMIFPIGKYMMLSSDKVRDLYVKISYEIRKTHPGFLMDMYDNYLDSGKLNAKQVELTIINFLEKSNYKKNIYNLNEQMVICKKYYMVHGDYEHLLKKDLLK